ncbi:MAG: serine/threonine protein kinase, partial [Acidobacteria bacterium]|nr:serine/threonine protein kinase [Acidobacteriota bacterium]
ILGRGGMGEVYRATDLKLNQQVALKFLPESMTGDQKAMTRFLNEVKIARQIANPNVCRVYDIGDLNGQPYISMEFISGEDLNSLLRRIGRIPAAKATEMARQLCSGLAAAHELGVLHRDLKPANIMLDEKGSLRIMDFGLAGLNNQIADVRSGTPAYMAPEQLAGKEVSVKSDLYSLGLVLYEIFTGKRPFEAATLDELRERQISSAPDSMTTQIVDLHPAVERVVLRCLAPDPNDRPASANAVASALPGGDALGAAVAAGETPSPELVAAAGESESMPMPWAVGFLAVFFASLAMVAWLAPQVTFFGLSKPEMSPALLQERAMRIVRRAGLPARPMDTAQGLYMDHDYLRYRDKTAPPETRWTGLDQARPGVLFFWYRESPRFLVAHNILSDGLIGLSDPPQNLTNMATVQMDMKGRLTSLEIVPPQVDESAPVAAPVDWAPYFRFAGLDLKEFKPVEPTWQPLAGFDARAAWEGQFAGAIPLPVRVEAASWRGKPVYFDVIGPWTRAFRMEAPDPNDGPPPAARYLFIAVISVLVGAVVFFARFHLRRNRGDRGGAFRLGVSVVVAYLCIQLIGGHHVPSREEFVVFFIAAHHAVIFGVVCWLLYLALEPPVRRRWPQTMVSWSRVLAGQIRNPLVGEHVLAGLSVGMLLTAIHFGVTLAALTRGDGPNPIDLKTTMGMRYAIAALLANAINSASYSMLYFFALFLAKIVFRRDWLAGAVVLVVTSVAAILEPGATSLNLISSVASIVATVVVLLRFGLLGLVTMSIATGTARRCYLAFDPGAWYGESGLVAFAALSVLSVLAFRWALGGRRLIADHALDV